jgi:hypothetical protein
LHERRRRGERAYRKAQDVSLGTIHPVTADLFVVEGDTAVASAAVYRRSARVYLIDTGAGPEQRSSIRALVMSYGMVDELTLVSRDSADGPDSNDDLLVQLPARRRRHLRPAGGPSRAAADAGVVVESYEALGHEALIVVGGGEWYGWDMAPAGLQLLRLRAEGEPYTVVHVHDCRTLLLPGRPAVGRLGEQMTAALRTLAESMHVVCAGWGPPMDRAGFEGLLTSAAPRRQTPKVDVSYDGADDLLRARPLTERDRRRARARSW